MTDYRLSTGFDDDDDDDENVLSHEEILESLGFDRSQRAVTEEQNREWETPPPIDWDAVNKQWTTESQPQPQQQIQPQSQSIINVDDSDDDDSNDDNDSDVDDDDDDDNSAGMNELRAAMMSLGEPSDDFDADDWFDERDAELANNQSEWKPEISDHAAVTFNQFSSSSWNSPQTFIHSVEEAEIVNTTGDEEIVNLIKQRFADGQAASNTATTTNTMTSPSWENDDENNVLDDHDEFNVKNAEISEDKINSNKIDIAKNDNNKKAENDENNNVDEKMNHENMNKIDDNLINNKHDNDDNNDISHIENFTNSNQIPSPETFNESSSSTSINATEALNAMKPSVREMLLDGNETFLKQYQKEK